MTVMYIDNKATAKRPYETYSIDRNEYPGVNDLKQLAFDCLNKDVYLIRVTQDNSELFTIRNYQ